MKILRCVLIVSCVLGGISSVSAAPQATPTGTVETLLPRLEKLAREQQAGILLLKIQHDAYTFMSKSFPGVVVIDAVAPDLFSSLEHKLPLDQADIRENLCDWAKTMSKKGVEARAKDELLQAAQYYRFALFVALRYRIVPGILAVASSYGTLRRLLGLQLYRDIGSDLPQLKALLELIKKDGRDLLPLAQRTVTSELVASDLDGQVRWQQALYRIAALAADTDVRQKALTTLDRLDGEHHWTDFYEDLIDELSEIELLGLFELHTADGSVDQQLVQAHSQLATAWALYEKYRQRLDKHTELGQLLRAYNSAFQWFERHRFKVVSAGGAFGHRLSYTVSNYLQQIGQDYVYLLTRTQQPAHALEIAERLRSRAMADWMGRTHLSNRTFMTGFTGSDGVIRPATLVEVKEAASSAHAQILFYQEDLFGYSVWLQCTDGRLLASHIDNPQVALTEAFRLLPQGAQAHDNRGAFVARMRTAETTKERDASLYKLFLTLVPAEFRAAIVNGPGRLIVVADGMLGYVPFCALEPQPGRYLIENVEILYWPSVTAWLLTQGPLEVQREVEAFKKGVPMSKQAPIVVMGNSAGLTTPQGVLQPLPGAKSEAIAIGNLLGAKPLLDSAAKIQSIFGISTGTRVVHVATHGVLNVDNPENSYLVLADGTLTARQLYDYDPGLRVRLVMLSACDTALGKMHPDSQIGLANAFLVVGARTVGSTLWNIPDDVTTYLMVRFYSKLRLGASVATALRSAQLDALNRDPTPYGWAAFKITGSNDNPLSSTR